MRTVKHPLTGEMLFPDELPSMTSLDKMRQNITNSIAQRLHKHIKPHPHAIDENDVIVEREGWLTEDEMRAIAYAIIVHDNVKENKDYDLVTSYRTEALKRNVI